MGRTFQATIDIASAATNRDILELTAGSATGVKIHEVVITTDVETDTNEEQIELQVSRRTGAFTSGSGGATAVAYALGIGGAAEDTSTVETGNTTKATGGTNEILANVYMNNRVGWHYLPTPECRPVVAATDAFIITMTGALGTAAAFGGYVVYEELVS